MTPSEIRDCLDRANEVINGFKKPSERNARDVVALVRWFTQRKPETKTQEMPDFLKGLFR